MKKILSIFVFLFAVLSVMAQDKTLTIGGLAGVTYTAAERKTAAFNYVYKIDIPSPVYYTYSLHLDDTSVTPTNQATAVFAGSLDGTNYKTITTVTYKSNGTDTTIIGNLTSSPVTYKYLRWTITPSDTIWVKSIWMNILPVTPNVIYTKQ